ncbi:hypothetical protein CCY99_06805 [Helicobacter sp. 16-1353]|uniref:TDP-N-acetylfucosamine:lipid II N-acetylfucosaminyltransferase n=1 Tax=Helicobacter sp. 16-1353 TaxID=2004996 RepID=UPI000DCED7ED|nr:TDP-N-acetylfucosamine:lipid II N-acetylfucosaminyltransferase [Helicobacter sp. 16-1353]RAX53070.1 hypothetical protein CCY99_06805 [Helicobacter sp. 16-1353]
MQENHYKTHSIHSIREIRQSKIHIMLLEKFIPNFLIHAKEYLDFNTHIFIIFADKKQTKLFRIPPNIAESSNIIIINSQNYGRFSKYFYILKYIIFAKKIFLHGLWIKHINTLLLLSFWKLNKCHWLIWGGDLYEYNTNKFGFYEVVRKMIIKRFGFITPVVYGDFKLAQKFYKTKAKCIGESFYMQFYEKYQNLIQINNTKTIIQIGNSATKSNNHLKALEILLPYKDMVQVILPLSYGDMKYAENIARFAKTHFNDVVILKDFMPLDEYNKILQKIDIAIFALHRQQAMGNIFILLFLGKKIYLESSSTMWDSLTQKGFKIFNINDFNINKLSLDSAKYNKNLVLKYYSKEKQIENFRLVFENNF